MGGKRGGGRQNSFPRGRGGIFGHSLWALLLPTPTTTTTTILMTTITIHTPIPNTPTTATGLRLRRPSTIVLQSTYPSSLTPKLTVAPTLQPQPPPLSGTGTQKAHSGDSVVRLFAVAILRL